MNRQHGIWILAFLISVLAVLVLALMPAEPRMLSTGWDKSNHLLAFSTLAWLGSKVFAPRLGALAIGLLAYGGLIEVLQSYTPTRSAEWMDLLADAVGIAVGLAVWRWVTKSD